MQNSNSSEKTRSIDFICGPQFAIDRRNFFLNCWWEPDYIMTSSCRHTTLFVEIFVRTNFRAPPIKISLCNWNLENIFVVCLIILHTRNVNNVFDPKSKAGPRGMNLGMGVNYIPIKTYTSQLSCQKIYSSKTIALLPRFRCQSRVCKTSTPGFSDPCIES